MQGDGEIAGHTCDVAGRVTLEVELLKGLDIEGPILFPRAEDLPPLARPFTAVERRRAIEVAASFGLSELEETAPISFVGSGPDLNAATDNGLKRAADVLGMNVCEVRNRATINGAIEIGRHPGVVHVTLLAPIQRLERRGLDHFAREQYELQPDE